MDKRGVRYSNSFATVYNMQCPYYSHN